MSRGLRKIVLYAVNGSGMGHVTRLLAVARWLRRYVTLLEGRTPEIVFLTSSEATGVLLNAGFASFKLPSKGVVRDAGMNMVSYRRQAKHFVWQVLGTMSPDLIVVDTFPSGSFDELFQVLDGPFRKGLILREVKPEYAAQPVFRAALSLYDMIVVPHDRERTRVPATPKGKPVTFTGEVLQLERAEGLDAAACRALLGVPEGKRLVYVSAGGGGDGGSEAALRCIVETLARWPDVHVIVGAGPLYRGQRLGGAALTWWTEPQVACLFGGIDAAISAAGYNTFHELLYFGVPTAFYAQSKIADDQQLRVRRAADAGACLVLGDPQDVTQVAAVAAALLDSTELSQRARAFLPDNGARRAAEALLAGSYDDTQVAAARAVLGDALVHALETLPDRGAGALARWLPMLIPAERLRSVVARPALEALLQRVPRDAAEAVRDAMDAEPEAADLAAAQRALVRLVEATRRAGIEAERAFATCELALRKHPLSQERQPQWLPWIEALLGGLTDLLVGDTLAGLSPDQRVDLYRVAPRLVDAPVAQAFSVLKAFFAARVAAGDDASAIAARLRDLKREVRRITVAAMNEATQ
ncbi:MAG: UDP-N-acetylglucosamine--N-acetylmuramyl-(pentapeptide) pyrophosphoryl-undecaprenol N-acetylglucosamine transferase [Myxococcota bacterium]